MNCSTLSLDFPHEHLPFGTYLVFSDPHTSAAFPPSLLFAYHPSIVPFLAGLSPRSIKQAKDHSIPQNLLCFSKSYSIEMEFPTPSLSFLLLIALFLPLVQWVYQRFFSRHSLPVGIPWAGVNNRGIFSRARSVLRSLGDTRELLDESYTKVSCTDLQ